MVVSLVVLFTLIQGDHALGASGGVTATGKVNPSISVTVSTTNVLLEGMPGSVVSTSTPITVNVKSNTSYSLSVKASGDLVDAATGLTLPLSRLAWSNAGMGVWNSFGTVETTLAPNEPRTLGTGKDYNYDYQLNIDIADEPGTYSTDIIYTAVAI